MYLEIKLCYPNSAVNTEILIWGYVWNNNNNKSKF